MVTAVGTFNRSGRVCWMVPFGIARFCDYFHPLVISNIFPLTTLCVTPMNEVHFTENCWKGIVMNKRSPFQICSRLVVVVGVLVPLLLLAQEPQRLTLDNMNDPTIMQAFSTPRVWWLEDNTALIYDTRKPPMERTLERFNPADGKRAPHVDAAKALEHFKTFFPEGKAPFLPPMPSEITKDGTRGLYLIGGDLFVLEFAPATFQRVTDTPDPERSANLSPDGLKVAFVRANDLYAYDLEAKKERRLTNDGSETILNGTLSWVYWEEIFGRQDIGYWWSKDSKAVAFLRTDESMVSVQHYVDIAPWTPTVTKQRYPKVGEKNPDVKVGIIEIEGSTTTWAQLDPSSFEYIIRVDWLPNNKQVAVRTNNRLQTELDLHLIDRFTGKAKHVLKDLNEGWINISDDLFFLKDGKHLIISSERDGYEHLYRFTLEGKLVNQITKGNWAIRSSGGGAFWVRQAVAGIDEQNGWIYFTALERSPLEKHLYRIKVDGSGMKRLTTEAGTHAINMSPNTKFYFDRFSNISTPPSLALYETGGTKKTTLADPNPAGFEKYGLQTGELIQIPARDGFLLPAHITKPRDFDPSMKYPVIVNVYGGPSAPQVSNSFSFGAVWENVLLNEGYICMTVDNRAATAISKKLENLFLKRSLGEVELDDLVDAMHWMKRQPYVDPDRFGIWGWSGGGSNTILAMTRSKEFKAGIAGAGVTDFRFYDTKWGEAMMKTEKENLEGFETYSLLKYAKDLHGRLLIIHGTHDDNVHIQNTWRFVDELVKANKLFELMVYPMRKHGVGDMAGRRHMNHLMLDFWKRNL